MAKKFVKQVLPTPYSVDFPSFDGYRDEDADMVRASDDVFKFCGELFREYGRGRSFGFFGCYPMGPTLLVGARRPKSG